MTAVCEITDYYETLTHVVLNAGNPLAKPMSLEDVVLFVWNQSRLNSLREAKGQTKNWVSDTQRYD